MSGQATEYVIKHSKYSSDNLKYDFMPDILEIIERPAHKAGKIIIFSIFSLLIFTVLWAIIAKTDVVVTAQGSVIPEGDIVSVQAYSSGTVKEINAVEGQYVNEGDLLIEMYSMDRQAEISNIKSEISVRNDEVEIYQKLISGVTLDKISLDNYGDESKSYLVAIIEYEKEYNNSLKMLENTLELAKSEYEQAVDKRKSYEGDGQYAELLENQIDIEREKKIAKDNAELNIDNLKSQHMSDLNNSYSSIKYELSTLSTELQKANVLDNYNKIYSPVSGYVYKLTVNSEGDIVSSYQDVLTIIPGDIPLQVKAYVNNKDIANICQGDEVRVKLDAYPYSDYGVINGKVKSISPGVYAVENVGNAYQVIVELEDSDNMDIISGLTGTIEIKVGERSIISYFLDPLLNAKDSIFKEQ